MFPRKNRVKREDFATSLASGRRYSSTNFSIVVPKTSTGYAVVVSKKVAKLSVTRHKVKRRVVAALRTLNPKRPTMAGVGRTAKSGFSLPPSLIIFPKVSAVSMSFKDTKAEISLLLHKINN